MTPLTITFRITERGFTYAEFADRTDAVALTVQASSAVNMDGHPKSCLRDCQGNEEPGTSALWLRVYHPGNSGESASVSLSRANVADLAMILTRWLATGFVEK